MDSSSAVEASTVEASTVGAWDLLAAVADPVRWRLLTALRDGGTRCVCDLQPVAGVAANLLSYHLKVLREASLVEANRRGRWIDYALAEDAGQRLHQALPVPAGAPKRPTLPVVSAGGPR